MWEVSIYRKDLRDTCKDALKALKVLFQERRARVENVGTVEGVQVLVANVSEAVNIINQAGYETDEDM